MIKKRLFSAGLVTETNTFSPFSTKLEDYETSDNTPDNENVGFLLSMVEEYGLNSGWEIVRGFWAAANPSGITSKIAYETFKLRILDDLKEAMPVDAVVLLLHGAMVAENYNDCEGDLLEAVRGIIGDDVPLGVASDAHAHLSKKMQSNADIMVFMKEWPHIDVPQTIKNAVDLTLLYADKKINPCMAVWDCRMIDDYHTLIEPCKSFIDEIKNLEKKENILSISIIHGFSHADVPDMGTKILVITNNKPLEAKTIAENIGKKLFNLRGKTHREYLSLDQCIEEIRLTDKCPIVVADIGDIPDGGAPGDSTILLKGIIDEGFRDVAIAYIKDPKSVALAIKSGEGSQIELSIGGKISKYSGNTLKLKVDIIKTFQDLYFKEDDGGNIIIGDVAVVLYNDIYICLAKESIAALSSKHFTVMGIEPEKMKLLIVKSANNFYAGFEKIAKKTLYVDAGGLTSTNLSNYNYTQIKRPKWPFDEELFF